MTITASNFRNIVDERSTFVLERTVSFVHRLYRIDDE